ncbi:uncharacterized protein IWZ02DRAFT_384875 [Phyllosticta citriasiana]|uniref:ER membrane protein complex subunit 7 beta-sandwich domain-containing protein n=1 Tax=Phyllosticta citriasiana TaxID=595635 RepID=A0ABR1L1Y9_9PEZI
MRLTPRSSRSSQSSTHSLLTAATAAALLSSSALVSAANITLSIGTAHSAVPSLLGASTHATLHSAGPAMSAPLRRDNSFAFADVAPGSYLLSVHSRDYAFENLRVDVGVEKKAESGQEEVVRAWQTFRGNEWDNRGEKRGEGRGGRANLEVRVMGGKEYYIQRGGFSPLSFLKNPMILMGLFSLGLIVGMPYLMDNMDEETRAEFEEMQKKSPLASAGNPAAQLQNFDLASFLAGKTNDGGQQQSAGETRGERSGGSGGGARRRG